MMDVSFGENVRSLVHSRHHYDSEDSAATGQGQNENCKDSHLPVSPKEQTNSFFSFFWFGYLFC